MSAEKIQALSAAREILKQNPAATPLQLAALAWLEGRISLCQEFRPLLEPKASLHEYDVICRSCGRRAGSRFLLAQDAPPHGYIEDVCFHCSANDEPRAA